MQKVIQNLNFPLFYFKTKKGEQESVIWFLGAGNTEETRFGSCPITRLGHLSAKIQS